MTKMIVFTKPDGGLARMMPAPAMRLPEETDEVFLSRIAQRDVPPGQAWRVVESAQMPVLFPDDVVFDLQQNVVVDMSKARQTHLNRVRMSRDKALAALDVEVMRALESDNTVALQVLAQKKQTLRDLPQTLPVATAQTPESLAALWPTELLGPM